MRTLGRPAGWGRTFLFVPGNRPDRFEKALAAGADVVVFDLEDAVAVNDKVAARGMVAEALRTISRPCAVRVNAVGTPWHADDVAMVAASHADVMLPKAESASQVVGLPLTGETAVMALVETPTGVHAATEIAQAERVARLAFGSLDYAASLGIDPDNRTALFLGRAQLVLASGVAGLAGPVDGVTASLRDLEQLDRDATYAKDLGYAGKLCIHPAQVEPARRAFAPSVDDQAWARRVVDAVASAESADGVLAVDGMMIDAPVVKRAEAILQAVAGTAGE